MNTSTPSSCAAEINGAVMGGARCLKTLTTVPCTILLTTAPGTTTVLRVCEYTCLGIAACVRRGLLLVANNIFIRRCAIARRPTRCRSQRRLVFLFCCCTGWKSITTDTYIVNSRWRMSTTGTDDNVPLLLFFSLELLQRYYNNSTVVVHIVVEVVYTAAG